MHKPILIPQKTYIYHGISLSLCLESTSHGYPGARHILLGVTEAELKSVEFVSWARFGS